MSSAARTTRPPELAPAATATRPLRLFTVDEYHRLYDVGVLKSGDRCELIHGLIVEKPVINPPHATAVSKLMRRLLGVLGAGACVRVQQPVTLPNSEPEPDVAVARGTDDDYTSRHPRPKDVDLVVEVADSSLPDDRTTKFALYAGVKIPVYWIVNLEERQVEVYTEPRGGKAPAYRQRADYGPGDAIPVVARGKQIGTVAAADLLP